MKEANLVAVDISKNTFHIRAVTSRGKAVYDGAVSRARFKETVMKFPVGTQVVMEACGGAQHWGRELERANYPVQLIAPQYVKPYVKRQKNDRNDAEAIAEAASRSSMRFVPVKPEFQQEVQAIHCVRERLVGERVRLTNEVRGILLEFGIAIPLGDAALRRELTAVIDSGRFSALFRKVLRELRTELSDTQARIDTATRLLEELEKSHDVCKRLATVPGIGPITSTALFAMVGHMHFKNGRELAAYLGLVPRQHSTGGKPRLGKISKQGNVYLRKLLIHGARSVVQRRNKTDTPYNSWVKALFERTKSFNKTVVGVANKNARIVRHLLHSDAVFVQTNSRQSKTD